MQERHQQEKGRVLEKGSAKKHKLELARLQETAHVREREEREWEKKK